MSDEQHGGLSPDDFLELHREIRTEQLTAEQAVGAARNTKKRAKAKGLDLEVYKLDQKFDKMEPEDAVSLIKRALRYGTWRNAAYATQFNLFAQTAGALDNGPTDAAVQAEKVAQAEYQGRLSGARGGKRDENPYPAGSEMHFGWDKGWANGNQFWTRSGSGVAVATGTGRGRPPSKKTDDAAAAKKDDAPAADAAPKRARGKSVRTAMAEAVAQGDPSVPETAPPGAAIN